MTIIVLAILEYTSSPVFHRNSSTSRIYAVLLLLIHRHPATLRVVSRRAHRQLSGLVATFVPTCTLGYKHAICSSPHGRRYVADWPWAITSSATLCIRDDGPSGQAEVFCCSDKLARST